MNIKNIIHLPEGRRIEFKEVIAPVFKRLGIIEQWGTGLKIISKEMAQYPDVELVWSESGSAFQVQFIRGQHESQYELQHESQPESQHELREPMLESETQAQGRPKKEVGPKGRPELQPESGQELGQEPESQPESKTQAYNRPKKGIESKAEKNQQHEPGQELRQELRQELGQELRQETIYTRILELLNQSGKLSRQEIANKLGHESISGRLNIVIRKLLDHGLIEWTIPEKPKSSKQRHRLTETGDHFLQTLNHLKKTKP